MKKYRILKGLPAQGPEPISFPHGQTLAREGFVVRFENEQQGFWIANFLRGPFEFEKVLAHPDGSRLVICADGYVYYANPENETATLEFEPNIILAEDLPQFNAVLLGDNIKFFAIDSQGIRWKTPRISWDGFQKIEISNNTLSGEAHSPLDNKWHPFEIDLETGKCKGSIYEIQMSQTFPINKSSK